MESGKVFVGGISWDTNDDRLREYFLAFGDVVEAVIMKDRATGRARGFGFVVFADPSIAEKVVKEKHIIDGRTVSNLRISCTCSFLDYICIEMLYQSSCSDYETYRTGNHFLLAFLLKIYVEIPEQIHIL